MRTTTRLLLVALVALGGLGACKNKDSGEGLAAQEPCGPAPSEITTTNLPDHFPSLDGVVYTQTTAKGPSTDVVGYANNSLDGLFKDLKEKFGADPYAIVKSEKDAHDAEVNFKSDTDKVTGQVALSEDCKGRLRVHVIVRPA
jgi:hypothetical protein